MAFCTSGVSLAPQVPQVLVTDGASAFVSKGLIQALCKMLQVAHKTTVPHHPQAHGIVEQQRHEIVAPEKKIFINIEAATDEA